MIIIITLAIPVVGIKHTWTVGLHAKTSQNSFSNIIMLSYKILSENNICNVRSVLKKLNDICSAFDKHQTSIVAITETWISEKHYLITKIINALSCREAIEEAEK